MKRFIRLLFVALLGMFIFISLVGCDKPTNNEDNQEPSNGNETNNGSDNTDPNQGGDKPDTPAIVVDPDNVVDYAGSIKLDMNSETLKLEVTVKTFVDGDTTHFNVPESVLETGVIKARYLAVNTPESTGKIEEYGKTASNFTKEKLSNATSIIIESDDDKLNADSTGGRYLLWVWYKDSTSEDYRNLNIEILQNGLAVASNSASNRYGQTCVAAIEQAKVLKLNIYSGQRDPNYYYGTTKAVTLRELRTNIEKYNGVTVAFEGVVVKDSSQTVYVEEYDPELDMYFGMTVYYGFNAHADVLKILTVGNRVAIVGSVQFYETGGTYQVSGLKYRAMRPNDPSGVHKISEGHTAAYNLVDATTFVNGKVEIEDEENQETKTYDYAELAMSSSISMNNLKVVSVYTTNNPESSSDGAMTLTCECDGQTVKVRTIVLYKDGNLVTESEFLGKTINVKGIVDYFDGTYQIKLYSMNDVTFVE